MQNKRVQSRPGEYTAFLLVSINRSTLTQYVLFLGHWLPTLIEHDLHALNLNCVRSVDFIIRPFLKEARTSCHKVRQPALHGTLLLYTELLCAPPPISMPRRTIVNYIAINFICISAIYEYSRSTTITPTKIMNCIIAKDVVVGRSAIYMNPP